MRAWQGRSTRKGTNAGSTGETGSGRNGISERPTCQDASDLRTEPCCRYSAAGTVETARRSPEWIASDEPGVRSGAARVEKG